MNTPDSTNKMRTPNERNRAAALAGIAALLAACKKDSDALFELNPVTVDAANAGKDKLKSNEQFVSILYTNLFQSAISNELKFDLNRCLESIGDKELAREVLISNFFNEPGVQMPSAEQLNADIDAFVEDTYARFFVRKPSEAEKLWVKSFIQNNPYMTPELVYFSFALSNEYQYY